MIRFWRSKFKVTAGRLGGEDIYVNTGASVFHPVVCVDWCMSIFVDISIFIKYIYLLLNHTQGTKKNKHIAVKTEIIPSLKKQEINQCVNL